MSTNPLSTPGISRIVLIGFMGAGKSTVGGLLAAHLQWDFIDADSLLEARSGSNISEIFARHGEAEFRRLEAGIIRELLQRDRLVLAVGGGAVETESTRDVLLQAPATHVVFLEAPLAVMIARCEQQPDAAVRPILMDRDRLSTRFENRLPHYRKAHLTIDTAHLTAEDTALKIMECAGFQKENTPA